jgi:phytoene dehydrogenase-like protein
MERVDAVVLGAGPSGLGAGLALARAGATVVVLEAAERVGGLCITVHNDGFAYDLGGHIPFVRDERRREWLADLLEGDLHWVDRPVACVVDGRIVSGRYLDRRPDVLEQPVAWDETARGELGSRFGGPFVDRAMRPYLEKIDGIPLESIPGQRAVKLMVDQAAPDGFWFPGSGIGQLMDAMAGAIEDAGGEVALRHRARRLSVDGGRIRGVTAIGPSGERHIAADALVVGVPAGLAARLAEPRAPAGATPEVRMRAVCLVYLAIDTQRVSDEPWIQVDHPRVPFSRAFEPANWSDRLAAPGRTLLGLECYCQAADDDPVWSLDDVALGRHLAETLADELGWIDSPGQASLVEVVRLPRAYPVPDLAQMPQVSAPGAWLAGIGGVHLAPGAAVVEAIDKGEEAAGAILAGSPRGVSPA